MTVLSSQQEIDILITEAEIAARTNNLARQITDHYKGTEQLVVVGLLRGSFVFIADLVRRLALPVEVDFMTVSSYGNDTVSSRQVRIIQDLETTIKNRDVLIVEDIVDTGHTLSQVQKILLTRSPKSLSICTLLNKPSRREVDVDVDWVGFDIPDAFVIGYGIDYAQQGAQPAAYRCCQSGKITSQLFISRCSHSISQEKPSHNDRWIEALRRNR
jgi:hypoxanthine phosphoribosyltransferase